MINRLDQCSGCPEHQWAPDQNMKNASMGTMKTKADYSKKPGKSNGKKVKQIRSRG